MVDAVFKLNLKLAKFLGYRYILEPNILGQAVFVRG